MPETIKGTGVVWSTGGATFTGSLLGTHKLQSARLTRSSDSAEVRDENGDVAAKIFYNLKRSFAVTIVPSGATIAAAITSQDAWAPSPGANVTVSSGHSTIIPDAYNVISATINHGVTEVGTVDVELESFDANEVATTAIAAGP